MLNFLYRLQELEAEEKKINAERLNSLEYKELRGIKAGFDAKKRRYTLLLEDLNSLALELNAFPKRLLVQEQKLEQERNALYDGSVSSTKAINARETQIAALTDAVTELRALNAMHLGEQGQKQAAAAQLKAELEEEYARFAGIKQKYQAAQDIRKSRLDELMATKEQLKAEIAADSLVWFRSQQEKFGGSPVAQLNEQHVCSGCYTLVTPIAYKRTMQGQNTFCEKCGRILFI